MFWQIFVLLQFSSTNILQNMDHMLVTYANSKSSCCCLAMAAKWLNIYIADSLQQKLIEAKWYGGLSFSLVFS